MELIDRYIYAVTQRLPERQRADIKQELKGLIEDMLEERANGQRFSKEEVESVLLELGDPHTLAAKYRGYDRYLISPQLIEPYTATLKIVLFSTFMVLLCLFVIDTMAAPSELPSHVISFVASMLSTGLQVFGFVTLIFVLIQFKQRNVASQHTTKKKNWKPADLSQIPAKHTHIRKSDSVTSIIFTVLFTVGILYLHSVDLLGVWRIRGDEKVMISFFNSEVFRGYISIVWIIAALSLLKAGVQFVMRKRGFGMLIFHIAITVAVACLACMMLGDSAIWNTDFIGQLETAGVITAGSEGYDTVVSIWSGVREGLIFLIVLFALYDLFSEFYKWYQIKARYAM